MIILWILGSIGYIAIGSFCAVLVGHGGVESMFAFFLWPVIMPCFGAGLLAQKIKDKWL